MNDKMRVETAGAPAAIGPYSQAVLCGGMLYCSGQLGIDPASGAFAGAGVEEQAAQSLRNIRAILAQCGSAMEKVVKTTIFLVDMNDFAVVNKVYQQAFEGVEILPARSCVAVSKLPKGGLVEIELIAQA